MVNSIYIFQRKMWKHLAISYFLVYIAWRDPAPSAISALAY